MTQQDFFILVLKSLEACGILYMVSGSVGAMLYGEPRLTNDMDVVVEISPDQVEQLRSYFEADVFYMPSVELIREVIRRKGQFNIIHVESGSKVDLIIRKETPYAKTEFSRRSRLEFSENFQAQTARPEDIILSKMLAYQSGGLEKHVLDILSILEISGDSLDRDYLAQWIKQLGLHSIWQVISQHRKT
ncbi:MAG: nucleotidyl transferase AbiEii/AbiGii toxin family protein [Acidobacteria bacterium]|nr:nucleotidyl transferase AbiEii/AbiGii toxin family protein [Acidobacteriota bacterium]